MSGFSFSAPTSGTITSLAADFLVTAGAVIGNTTVHAQLYRYDSSGTGSFVPVGVPVNLSPVITGISVGEHLTGITAEAIPVVAGDQLALVFYATTDALLGVSAVTGIGSGGITI
jgi:BclB C-terminal domain-containing protein